MGLNLSNLSYSRTDLTPIQKHILLILCNRANEKDECYSTISRLISDSGYSKNTVEKTIKDLKEKGIINYTGKYVGKKNNIPVHKLILITPSHGVDKVITTPNEEGYNPSRELLTTPSRGVQKDKEKKKDNKKDNGNPVSFSLEPQNPEPHKPPVNRERALGIKALGDILKSLNNN